jgi:hypothetical protein
MKKVLLLSLISILLYNCKKETLETNDNIIGTWEYISMTMEKPELFKTDAYYICLKECFYYKLIIREDSFAHIDNLGPKISGNSYVCYEDEDLAGWNISGNKIHFGFSNILNCTDFEYSLSKDKLILSALVQTVNINGLVQNKVTMELRRK